MGIRDFFKNIIKRVRVKGKDYEVIVADDKNQTKEQAAPMNSAETIIIDEQTLEVVVEGSYQESQLPQKHRQSILRSLISPALQVSKDVSKVVVDCSEETKARVKFYNQLGRHVREEIVPQVALKAAYDDAEKVLVSMRQHGFDEEIVNALQAKLNERRAKHQGN